MIPAEWAQECDEIPSGYRLPYGYESDQPTGSIYLATENAKGEINRTRVTYGPLLPVAVYVDPAGNQMLELVWRDRRRWTKRAVPRAIAKSGRKLITALGDAGLPAVDADARGLERWLAAAEAANQSVIPRRTLARWLGWQPDGEFVTSAGVPHRVEPAYEDQAAAIRAHREHGTLEGWQHGVKRADPYPVAKACLAAGFAAPLLDTLRVDSFTIDISGRSTRGKTTAAKLGLSVWADPSEKGDGLFSWRTTLIATEKRLNICRGLPVVIDETRVVKFPELVDQVIYQIPKNHGQARGGGWPSLLPWSTIAISTGEQSALSFTTHQGAAARVLSIQEAPFGTGGADNGQAAADIGRSVDENYGVAGPVFIRRLQEHLAAPGGRTALRERHGELAEKFRGDTDISGRRAPMVAALVLAAQLAHQWGITTFEPLRDDQWSDLFTAPDMTDNRPEMALDVVREYVASHASDLWQPAKRGETKPPMQSPPHTHAGWIGRYIDVEGRTTVALLPGRLRDALKRSDYALAAVLPGWQEAGYLVKFESGRTPYLPVRKLGQIEVRMYVFKPGTVLEALKVTADGDE